MFSNHFDALPFENTDRRIIVIENPTQRAEPFWYAYLHQLAADPMFIASVLHFLMTLDISQFQPGAHAEWNNAKRKALDFQSSIVEKLVSRVCGHKAVFDYRESDSRRIE